MRGAGTGLPPGASATPTVTAPRSGAPAEMWGAPCRGFTTGTRRAHATGSRMQDGDGQAAGGGQRLVEAGALGDWRGVRAAVEDDEPAVVQAER